MGERVDAVVVGAGLGGLAAAVTLAGTGRKVLVLEQSSLPGGYASGFQRGPYRFDTALHALNGLAPGGGVDEMYKGLGIWERLRLHRLDPLYVMRGPGHEIVAHADSFLYEAELIRYFPDEADGIRAYLDDALAVYRDTRRLATDIAEGRKPTMETILTRYPAMVRASGETWDQMMSRHVADRNARIALGALWGYFGLPPSQLAAVIGAAAATGYHQYGGWYPEGGAQSISQALTQVLRERGGEMRFGQLVDALHFEGDRVAVVTTREGLRIEAGLVISNASAPTTMLDLVGRDRVPGDYAAKVERPTRPFSTFSVFLGLDRDLCAEHGLAHELFVDPGFDADAAWQASQQGDWDRTWIAVTDYTRVDPGCAPAGHGVVVLTTQAGWEYEDMWGTGGDLADYHQNPRYLELKDGVADVLVARAEESLPGLTAAIRERVVSTPLTNFHYTRNPGGAIEGYENSVPYSGLGSLPQQTPVPNLLLAGAWTNSGGMNAAMGSGVAAARRALALTPARAATGS
jgi:prolycopene isomerase